MGSLFLRWIKTIFRFIGVLLTIPVLAVAILLLTPLGLKISLNILNQNIPGQLHYQNVRGIIFGPLTLRDVSYQYQDQLYSASRVHLRWRPSALLAGKLDIIVLDIDDLSITIPQAPAPKFIPSWNQLHQNLQTIRPQLTALHLPFQLAVNSADIKNFRWRQRPGNPLVQAKEIKMQNVLVDQQHLQGDAQAQLIEPYPLNIQLSLKGSPQDYRFNLQAYNPQMHWVVDGKVNPQRVQLDAPQVFIFGGQFNAHLLWEWQSPISWELTLSGQHLDLSSLQSNLPQPIDIFVNSAGSLGHDHPHFSWNLNLKTPQSQLNTQGQFDRQWDIKWNFKTRQLAELFPFSSGAVKSQGELHGSLLKPQTYGHLEAFLLRWQDYRVDKLDAGWNIDFNQNKLSDFKIAAEELFYKTFEAQKLNLSGSGRLNQHTLNADIQAYDSHLNLKLNGGYNGKIWQGSIQNMMFNAPYVGDWQLIQPTALLLSLEKSEVMALCLKSSYQAQACLKASWNGVNKTWQTALTGRLNFQQISSLAPENVSINLPLDVHFSANGDAENLQNLQLNGSTSGGEVSFKGEKPVVIEIHNGRLAAQFDKSGGALSAHVNLANDNFIDAAISLPKATNATLFSKNQAVQGKLSLVLNNLSLVQAWLPDMINTRGKMQADFSVGGVLGEPTLTGHTQLEGGEIKIPGLNIQLDAIKLALMTKGKELDYVLNATSAGRPLQITGKTQLQPGFATEMTLTGDTVLLADTPTYTVYVSPNVHAEINGQNINISGNVEIPTAVLHQFDFQVASSLPEEEIVYIGEHPIVKASPWNLTLNLNVNLGKNVRIETTALKGKLSGGLTLLSQPKQVLLAAGRIDFTEGTLEFNNRTLSITPGSGIVYRRNPLTNPNLSLQATTKIIITDIVSQQQLGTNEITVGMNVAGTSTSPQITLFSSAGNLSQADMLSFLLLGTSSAGISPYNINLMLQALNTLPFTKKGAGNIQGFTNQIKQSLGLSEFGVESEAVLGPTGEYIPTATPTSYFVVGKRLSSRVYIRYKYDPFLDTNLFQLNYLFSQNWSLRLETNASNQNGIDVLYTIQVGSSKAANKSNDVSNPITEPSLTPPPP